MSQNITAFVKKTIMACEKLLQAPIKGILLDISGVLKDGSQSIPGSVEAVKSLQSAKIPFRLVTNETSRPIKTILSTLKTLGFEVTEKDLICPVPAVIKILKKDNLRPFLMIHPEVIPDFGDIDTSNPNCVVMGDAAECFHYKFLNECFRKLMGMKNPILFSLGQGKYFRDDDGLALDVGPFCKAIEYATGVKAIVVGKPSPQYFLDAVSELKLQPNEVVMIGDDVVSDVGGAQNCGLRGVLVRTGKYMRETDEPHKSVVPDGIVDNLQEAVNLILKRNS
ncbi:phospholysine phosphohistidine inorganic pyrophosphate phosphatase [Halyomorpha halys]|uniref:phospholysine phosphohistidine inorganic pyrophosphate phosphatase n=1 Tax=Halyomorpha halys TaxID=286706 RepID=UPI0006D4EC9E|nr:phospholysine phosphohistidine inorganic pyrophosphate phosphatase [Halyomorpha halys]